MSGALSEPMNLLSPGATTLMGSLPLVDPVEAVALAMQVDIPAWPQLPALDPWEFMIPQALAGGSGLELTADGMVRVVSRESFLASLEVPAGLPPYSAAIALQPFLAAVQAQQRPIAKVQLAGPVTIDRALGSPPGLLARLVPWLQSRAQALMAAVRDAGASPMLFWDEPWLHGLSASQLEASGGMAALHALVSGVRSAGGHAGLHCCGRADWAAAMSLPIDMLSVDAAIFLPAIYEETGAMRRFHDRGGQLCLGVVASDGSPTQPWDVWRRRLAGLDPEWIHRALLSPACGLAGLSVEQAFAVVGCLRSYSAHAAVQGHGVR